MSLLNPIKFPVVKLPQGVTRLAWGQVLELALRYAPTIEGRGSRTELVATVFACGFLSFVLTTIAPPIDPEDGSLSLEILPILFVTIVPIISAIIRRLHDTNRHAWSIIVIFAPYVGWAILLALLFWNPDPEENIFGPPIDG